MRLPLFFGLVFASCVGTVGDLGQTTQDPAAPHPSITSFVCTPTSGYAPLSTTCTIAVTDSNPQSALRCTLTADDGRPTVLDRAACRDGLTQAITFMTPGSFHLLLLVDDATGATATATVPLAVTERPNLAPAIASFTAMPAAGTQPLTTTVRWAVSDPDGDALTCDLDVGDDGTIDLAALDCAVATRQLTVTTAGTIMVRLTVHDARGLSASSVLTLTSRAPVGDVRLEKVEWGQSVVLETLRLVQGKPALLRAHVLSDTAGLGPLTVDAEGFTAAGVSLGKLPLVGPARVPTAMATADLAQQWTGTVPAAWVEPGLEVRLTLDPADDLPETNETNNQRALKPAVGRGSVLQLTNVPVVLQGVTGTPLDLQPIVTSLWPVKAVQVAARAPYTFSGTLGANDTNAWGSLLQNINALRVADGSTRDYYGWVHLTYRAGIAGIGYVGDPAAVGRDDSPDTGAHELGHNLGRSHAPCGNVSGADPAFPYPGGKIGSWGYDATRKVLVDPATNTDLMGYCDPAWVSDFNYLAVQSHLEQLPDVTPKLALTPMPVVLVAGIIRGGAEVSVRPLQRLVTTPSLSANGTWALRLTKPDGAQQSVPFAPVAVSDSLGDEQHFTFTIPDPGALVALEVLHDGSVVHRALESPLQAAQPNTPPRLERESASSVRLTWGAGAATLVHVADDGTRTTLALWLSGGAAVVPTTGLRGGHYDVSVSTGLNAEQLTLPAP
jgi:PKD repeat protein